MQYQPFQVLKSLNVKDFGKRYFLKQKGKRLKFATQKNGHSIYPENILFFCWKNLQMATLLTDQKPAARAWYTLKWPLGASLSSLSSTFISSIIIIIVKSIHGLNLQSYCLIIFHYATLKMVAMNFFMGNLNL